MSLKRIILASVATMFAANVAHAADLNLFGYEEKEGTRTATTILERCEHKSGCYHGRDRSVQPASCW